MRAFVEHHRLEARKASLQSFVKASPHPRAAGAGSPWPGSCSWEPPRHAAAAPADASAGRGRTTSGQARSWRARRRRGASAPQARWSTGECSRRSNLRPSAAASRRRAGGAERSERACARLRRRARRCTLRLPATGARARAPRGAWACGARRVASDALVEEHVGLGVVHLKDGSVRSKKSGGRRALCEVWRRERERRGRAGQGRGAGRGGPWHRRRTSPRRAPRRARQRPSAPARAHRRGQRAP